MRIYPNSFQELIAQVLCQNSFTVHGLWDGSRALFLARFSEQFAKPIIIVTSQISDMQVLSEEIKFFTNTPIYIFPPWETLPQDRIKPHLSITQERLQTLSILMDSDPAIIVTCLKSVTDPCLNPVHLKKDQIKINKNGLCPVDDLLNRLIAYHYERVSIVEELGQFAVRGGIVDVFPIQSKLPYRIEFLGNQVETIRIFDLEKQSSIQEVDQVDIFPCDELVWLEQAKCQESFIDDYLGGIPAIFCNPDELIAKSNGMFQKQSMALEDLWKRLKYKIVLSDIKSHIEFGPLHPIHVFRNETFFVGDADEELSGWQNRNFSVLENLQSKGFKIHIVSSNLGEEARVRDALADKKININAFYYQGFLQAGFMLEDDHCLVVTANELLHKIKRRRTFHNAVRTQGITHLSELREDDYVVHINYGVAQYKGFVHLETDTRSGEFIVLEFEGSAKLYASVDQVDLIEKYVGLQEMPPKKNKLGGQAWVNQKIRIERAIIDMASDLLEVQAHRKISGCTPLLADSYLEKEFEDEFMFEETPDQAQAIMDVKKDLEKDLPMDRLICGDVGFGKTEVAMRAAFRVVTNGLQVAILVPTTVLAFQHYRVFQERFGDFPICIEMLSRFRTKKEQADILLETGQGKIDILIGTHRLLSQDVKFKNLGMVIIDEEQRFGVAHKERLKLLRKTVHMLALSATPIPRTLYMALTKLRDISIINTPPLNRLPIETSVAHHNDSMVREAIVREITRGGQIFYIHNRIKSIQRVCEHLKKKIPGINTAVAHGQMDEHELEAIMKSFIEGQVQVLISTNIVESGLDIQNANTIIIEMADRFGLADLYQLRGRVGRTEKRAYAYLFYSEEEVWNPDAKKRLKALQDFTALGSGFQVALKDLEIRGAGNLLGKEQSGHIAVIGFKLYCQLLEKAVKKKKGIAVYEEVPVQCMLPITLEIPSHYVIEAELRLHLYRRINMIKNVKQAGEMRKELVDRFGLIPDTTENLIHLTVIKQKAMRKKVDAIMWQKGLLILRSQDKIIYREKLDIIEGQESIILNKIEKILERLPNLI